MTFEFLYFLKYANNKLKFRRELKKGFDWCSSFCGNNIEKSGFERLATPPLMCVLH